MWRSICRQKFHPVEYLSGSSLGHHLLFVLANISDSKIDVRTGPGRVQLPIVCQSITEASQETGGPTLCHENVLLLSKEVDCVQQTKFVLARTYKVDADLTSTLSPSWILSVGPGY